MRAMFTAAFLSEPLQHWTRVFGSTSPLADACVTPVLTLSEGQAVLQRGVGVEAALKESAGVAAAPAGAQRAGLAAATPVPCFSDEWAGGDGGVSQVGAGGCTVAPGAHSSELLAELGYDEDGVARLLEAGAVEQAGQRVVSKAAGVQTWPESPAPRL